MAKSTKVEPEEVNASGTANVTIANQGEHSVLAWVCKHWPALDHSPAVSFRAPTLGLNLPGEIGTDKEGRPMVIVELQPHEAISAKSLAGYTVNSVDAEGKHVQLVRGFSATDSTLQKQSARHLPTVVSRSWGERQ